MTQSNFRGFDRFVEKYFLNPQIVEFIKYDDEDLVLPENAENADNTEKCFKVLSKLDGIRFYADMPEKATKWLILKQIQNRKDYMWKTEINKIPKRSKKC